MPRPPQALPQFAKDGYATIVSIIVIGVIIVVIGTAVTYLAIGNAQSGLGHTSSEQVQTLAESCLEEALLTYNASNTIPSTLTLPQGNCTLTTTAQTSTTATLAITATSNNHTTTIHVDLERTSSLSIVNYSRIN